MMDYALLDSGDLKKLEKFGNYTIIRPCNQAIWKPKIKSWEADFIFSRKQTNNWIIKTKKNQCWNINIDNILLKLKLTEFGHIGFFPEHIFLGNKLEKIIKSKNKKLNLLNLFAYTGIVSLYALRNKAKVTHVDSSRPTISWAKEDVQLNKFSFQDIRWIEDDVVKFVKREVKRCSKYDGIILDPPSFGRGSKKEVFKIENDIYNLLNLCKQLLNNKFSFIIFSCHSPGFTKTTISNLFLSIFEKKHLFDVGELLIKSKNSYSMPSGFYAIWQRHEN